MPEDRLLVETDSPFWRLSRCAAADQPANVVATADGWRRCGDGPGGLERAVEASAVRVFGWPAGI